MPRVERCSLSESTRYPRMWPVWIPNGSAILNLREMERLSRMDAHDRPAF